MEKEKLEQKLKEDIPSLSEGIVYHMIIIFVTVFLYFIAEYFWLRLYTTEGAAALLRLLGYDAFVKYNINGNLVDIFAESSVFGVLKICSGIEAIALLSGMIIATPSSWKRKIMGVTFITFGIFGANSLRIMTTVILAVQGFPEFIYHQTTSAIFTIIFIIVFILMIQAWIIPNFMDYMINVWIGIGRAIKGS